MDISAPATGITSIWGKSGSPPTYSGYSGTNVIIGIISTGLDFNHLDFIGLSGTSRVLWLWDQKAIGSPQPASFNYGVEKTQAQVTSSPNFSADTDGIGTHLAGVAAASGRATSGSYAAYRYIGMAPTADLIIVKAIGTDYSIIDGANYIIEKATDAVKPCVILIGYPLNHGGMQQGGHDGGQTLDNTSGTQSTTNISYDLSQLAGGGKLIVAPAGDQGVFATHALLNLPSAAADFLNLVIPSYSVATQEYCQIETWHEPGTLFQVRVTGPSSSTPLTPWIQPGQDSGTIGTVDGNIIIRNDILTNSRGAKLIKWYLSTITAGARLRIGTWKLEIQRLASSTGGLLHSWVSDWRMGTGPNVSPEFSNHIDHNYKVCNPSWGDNVISVGGYYTRTTWTAFNGQGGFFVDQPTLYDADSKSSWGPRRDGEYYPNFLAPCAAIASCSAPFAGQASNLLTDDSRHVILRRGAVAAAHVAGALACLLQKQNSLTPAVAKQELERSVYPPDSYTGSILPNNKWGYGKFRVTPTTSYNVGGTGGGLPIQFPEDEDDVPS